MINLAFLKELLVEYKDELLCLYPNSMFCEENYKDLKKKEIITLKLFESIISYLEDEKARENGYYN